MRFFMESSKLICLCLAVIFVGCATALAQEKTMTPLSEGIPMIEGIKMLEVGAQAPDFRIKDANGVTFHYAEEKGKNSVLMVFWSIFCEPCRAEMPFIQKMYEKYKGKGLDVVSIALDGEPLKNSIVGFVKQEGYTFRILIDELDAKEMFKAADPYGVAGTPTVYLLDKTGKVRMAKAGRVTEEDLEKAIRSLLKK